MLNVQAQTLRRSVHGFLATLPVPQAVQADLRNPSANDGEIGFTHKWLVHGDAVNGLEASVRDYEDVIEFGLLERNGESAIPVLQAILVLENDESELNCMSEPTPSLNFDEYVTAEQRAGLDRALTQFASILAGEEINAPTTGA
ncbi:MAG: hypothetical protein EPN61_18300 [Burkholderiaceae bacterium]|jgi:hypothetical protein|nr:MAG: hypothetical protein EPN61_18300 [Burkholderiaceae bacterium]